MQLAELVSVSRAVAATAARRQKVTLLAELLARLAPEEIELGIAMLAGDVPGGKLGVGPALVLESLGSSTAGTSSIALTELRSRLEALRALRGPGSAASRATMLRKLFGSLSEPEREFLSRLLVGELRQGALAGVMEDALANAAKVPLAALRRAAMLSGDLVAVGAAALREGEAALAGVALELFRPVQPMLAGAAEDVAEVLSEYTPAAFEHKLDGARVQVHKLGGEVRVFTRLLNDVTEACPELVEAVRALPSRDLVLDGEALALRPDGRPLPFQVTMRRFGRKLDVAALRAELPLSSSFFDVLHADGVTLLDAPAAERFARLEQLLPPTLRIPRLVTADPDEAERFLAHALALGHEGVMAKSLTAPYEAGRRGKAWLKLKPAHTLDLVVLAAEWGNGRREGWLSNLHLGARDELRGGFVMLGKTFKGLTDELLTWQTKELLARELTREGFVVHVRPELVVEIAVNELQVSPRYPGGLALRFARVKRYRPDKRAADADTIATVRALHDKQLGQSDGEPSAPSA
jgi:DNA ligase-1